MNSGALPWSLPACGLPPEPLRRALLLLPLGERRGSLGMRGMPAPGAPSAAPAPCSRSPCAPIQGLGHRRRVFQGRSMSPSGAPCAGRRPRLAAGPLAQLHP